METIYRILDANFNRAKEGLRVVEEYCRFIENDKKKTESIKKTRHALTEIFKTNNLIEKIIQKRDVSGDKIALEYTEKESKRCDSRDVLAANIQRVKESLRVLEEYGKIVDARIGEEIQKLRFEIYKIEMLSPY